MDGVAIQVNSLAIIFLGLSGYLMFTNERNSKLIKYGLSLLTVGSMLLQVWGIYTTAKG